MDIENLCRINYCYRYSATSPIIRKTVCSNVVSTQIIREKLKITKFVNKDNANYFEILIYKIVIESISDDVIKNLYFKDVIPKGTLFIENSVEIKGMKKKCLNPQRGFCIGDLPSRGKVEIVFQVVISQINIYNKYKNNSDIIFDYIYNIEKPPIRVDKKSNKVITELKKDLFKQTIVENNIETSDNIQYISQVRCESEIIRSKVIDCHTAEASQVLVIGKVKYQIEYWSQNKRCIVDGIFGFSESILVPVGVLYLNSVEAKITVESICCKLQNKRDILVAASLLISI